MKGYLVTPGWFRNDRDLYRREVASLMEPDAMGLFGGASLLGQGEVKRFANLTGMAGATAVAQDMYSINIAQQHPLGTMAVSKDGRIFRYAQAGAVDLAIGKVNQSPIQIANHLALTSAAQAIGDGATTPIAVTPGATAGAANLYAEGQLVIEEGPGLGYAHRISGHPAIVASTAFNLYLDPDDLVQLAFTTSTKYGLHHNPWKNLLVMPTTQTASPAGVTVVALTAAYYGWVITRGPAAVLMDGTPAITTPVVVSGSVAGSVKKWTTAAADVAVIPVGRMMQTGVDTKYNQVFVQID